MKLRFLVVWGMSMCILPNLVLASPPSGAEVQKSQTEEKNVKSKKKKTKSKSEPQKTSESFENALKKVIETYQQQQFASSLVHCRQAMDIMPDDIPPHIQTSVTMMCLELLSKNERHEDVLVLAEEARQGRLDPALQQSLCFMEATSLTKLHRWKQARLKYAQCPGESSKDRAMILSNMAELAMIEGDTASAVSMYQSSLAHDDTNVHAAFGLAVALAREERHKESHDAFMLGVKSDPGFEFLKDAFFEPQSENTFQTAYRMMALKRLPEACFYLKKYMEQEVRPAYQVQAQRWYTQMQNRMKSSDAPCVARYPVVLQHVRDIALNADGSRIAFVTLEKSTEHDFVTVLWVLDTQNEITRRRLVLPETLITDIAFVGNSHVLRLLGIEHRYELDVSSQGNDYYVYENAKDALALFLTSSGEKVGRLHDDRTLDFVPWSGFSRSRLTDWKTQSDMKQMIISEDGQNFVYRTSLGVYFESNTDQGQKYALSAKFDVSDMAVHPSQDVFALGMRSGTLLVDGSGDFLGILGSEGQNAVSHVSFSPDGKMIAAFDGQMLEIWQTDKISLELDKKPQSAVSKEEMQP